MPQRQRLSVVMIAKNEAELLPEALASVSWADEIVLLDSGSQDNTVAVARAHGAQVHQAEGWAGFGKQRQRAQAHASGDMILMLDADERVTPELRRAIENVLEQPPPLPFIAWDAAICFLAALCAIAAGIRIA